MTTINPKIARRFEAVARSKTFHNLIQIFSLDQKAVLDVGCTYGEFLKHFGKESTGITIISEEVEVGHKLGLDIRQANIEYPETVKLDRAYDVIFANNIFEHMLSPHTFLLEMKKYVAPGGLLILGVPCVPKITWLLRLKKFRGSLASLHINFFTRDTLIKTVEYAGWSVKECRGFHFKNRFIDRFLDPIYPHFYVVATMTPNFAYSPKRAREVAGYNT
ncbi:class I SAM-dependent methyltransferase [Candidatus Parcubacteria bacterium]|nr:class I SAM-dependent methyltransferase [Candidatus Parcubacteria bacterium]